MLGKLLRREPIALREALDTLVVTVVGMCLAFGAIHWSEQQIAAVALAWKALTSLMGVVVRGMVTPEAKAKERETNAAEVATTAERTRIGTYLAGAQDAAPPPAADPPVATAEHERKPHRVAGR